MRANSSYFSMEIDLRIIKRSEYYAEGLGDSFDGCFSVVTGSGMRIPQQMATPPAAASLYSATQPSMYSNASAAPNGSMYIFPSPQSLSPNMSHNIIFVGLKQSFIFLACHPHHPRLGQKGSFSITTRLYNSPDIKIGIEQEHNLIQITINVYVQNTGNKQTSVPLHNRFSEFRFIWSNSYLFFCFYLHFG